MCWTPELIEQANAKKRGRKLSPDHVAAVAAGLIKPGGLSHGHKGTVWITDGVRSRRVSPSIDVPSGWRRGKTYTHRRS